MRIKVPERKLPQGKNYHIGMTAAWWHQDQGVFADDISEIDMLTVWLPLYDVTKESACLQLIPGSHRRGLSLHCTSSNPAKIGIPELQLGNVRHLVEMKAGDIHFHHRLIQHGSLRNLSDRLRFSFDLRYQPADRPNGQRRRRAARTECTECLGPKPIQSGRGDAGCARMAGTAR